MAGKGMKLQEMNPQELLNTYRKALRRKYKKDIADKTDLYYNKGWYYVNIARRFPDGSVGTFLPAEGKRRAYIEKQIKLLRR